ncbi:MAG TPA: hypothetical protein VKR06_07920 [Ktedonosporobacter sp.]|nr:hypothetical protein [Ktedonosporobacter sp.]
MQGCTTALSCSLGAWLQAHMVVFWFIVIAAAILLVGGITFIARCMRESWQDMQENQRLHAERENEWKVLQHRMQATIRRGEEWEVDVSDLRATALRLKLIRKATSAVDYEKALFILPFMPIIILIVLVSWIPALWVLIVLLGLLGLSVFWWIYHGWKWSRYRRALKALQRLETDPGKKSEHRR